MTSLVGNNLFQTAVNAAANQIAGQILQGVAYQLAQGIMAQFAQPLGAGPFASAMLPNLFNITAGRCCGVGMRPEPQQSWTATLNNNGTGQVNLGDGYRLELNEHNSEITIFNENTGERTRIWGDPHVEIDGKHAFDFWGTTTFTLANGTKLTINTEQWNGNPNAYVASQVVITRGNQALTIDGISQNKTGDLSITQGNNGRALDAAHRDGFVLRENRTGAGWRSEWTGKVATQKDLDATRIGAAFGPGSQAMSMGELNNAMSSWLLLGSLMRFASGGGGLELDARTERKIERMVERAVDRAVNRAFA